jgi:hypothetical protein
MVTMCPQFLEFIYGKRDHKNAICSPWASRTFRTLQKSKFFRLTFHLPFIKYNFYQTATAKKFLLNSLNFSKQFTNITNVAYLFLNGENSL